MAEIPESFEELAPGAGITVDQDGKAIKTISVKEFRALGYLQELNRLFLHPLGLAMGVEVDEDGNEEFGEIWDYRDDPEGIVYDDGLLDEEAAARAIRIKNEQDRMAYHRVRLFGSKIQKIKGMQAID